MVQRSKVYGLNNNSDRSDVIAVDRAEKPAISLRQAPPEMLGV
jgi:hypothetical protein